MPGLCRKRVQTRVFGKKRLQIETRMACGEYIDVLCPILMCCGSALEVEEENTG